MEINPYESRLRMLQQFDGVQMQREAAPDEETAGCPGCPYFWTCPIPHKGEEVRAPQEIELEDVQHELGPRRAYRPRDESDVGWLDEDDEPEPETEPGPGPGSEALADLSDDRDGAGGDEGEDENEDEGEDVDEDDEDIPDEGDGEVTEVTRPRGWWNPFRRRR